MSGPRWSCRSSHHVAPASASGTDDLGRGLRRGRRRRARRRTRPGSRAARRRTTASSRTSSSGRHDAVPADSNSGTTPSHRAARRIGGRCGQTPAIQIGTRGCCTGRGQQRHVLAPCSAGRRGRRPTPDQYAGSSGSALVQPLGQLDRVRGVAEAAVLVVDRPAQPDAERDPAAGERVEGRDLPGQRLRPAPRDRRHQRAQPQPGRGQRRGGQQHPRVAERPAAVDSRARGGPRRTARPSPPPRRRSASRTTVRGSAKSPKQGMLTEKRTRSNLPGAGYRRNTDQGER